MQLYSSPNTMAPLLTAHQAMIQPARRKSDVPSFRFHPLVVACAWATHELAEAYRERTMRHWQEQWFNEAAAVSREAWDGVKTATGVDAYSKVEDGQPVIDFQSDEWTEVH